MSQKELRTPAVVNISVQELSRIFCRSLTDSGLSVLLYFSIQKVFQFFVFPGSFGLPNAKPRPHGSAHMDKPMEGGAKL